MEEQKIIDNRITFIVYGVLNIVLLLVLIAILILYFNDVFVLSRFEFVLFIGVHLFLLFYVKVHYLRISVDPEKQHIEFHYNMRFGLAWQKNIRSVLLPRAQFDGYELEKNSIGISVISFYKIEKEEQFELGPFFIGFLSSKERQLLQEALGSPRG